MKTKTLTVWLTVLIVTLMTIGALASSFTQKAALYKGVEAQKENAFGSSARTAVVLAENAEKQEAPTTAEKQTRLPKGFASPLPLIPRETPPCGEQGTPLFDVGGTLIGCSILLEESGNLPLPPGPKVRIIQ